MAKKITKDPSPYLEFASGVEPEVVSNDFNLFYKPDVRPQNKALNSLIASLSNIVPTLATYEVTEQVKEKEKDEAKAIKDMSVNKKAFDKLIVDGKIPASASPFYYNKMMELDLINKSRKFQKEFNELAGNSKFHETLNADGWTEAYEGKLKQFYTDEGLEKYDPLALKVFFDKTTNFRNQEEQKHNAKRLAYIQSQTENSEIMNIAGLIIEGQDSKLSPENLLTDLKTEIDSLISVNKNKDRSNNIFVKGLESYIENVNDETGLIYAGKLLNKLKTFTLGTGYFGGGSKGKFLIKKFKSQIAEKERSLLEQQNKLKAERLDFRKAELADIYWNRKEEDDLIFDINILTEEKIDTEGEEVGKYKYSSKDKAYLLTFHNAVQKGLYVIASTPSAIEELEELQNTNPYTVKDKAKELLEDGELTITDFKLYFNFIDTYKKFNISLFNNNFWFQESMDMFKDTRMAQHPALKMSLGFMRADYQKKIWNWYKTNKEHKSIEELDNLLETEAKRVLGEIFSNSLRIQRAYSTFAPLFAEFGIVVIQKDKKDD